MDSGFRRNDELGNGRARYQPFLRPLGFTGAGLAGRVALPALAVFATLLAAVAFLPAAAFAGALPAGFGLPATAGLRRPTSQLPSRRPIASITLGTVICCFSQA